MPAAVIGLMGTMMASSAASASAEEARATMEEGTAKTLAQKQKMFDIAQEQLAPYREVGEGAIQKIKSVFVEGNMDEFFESAGYQFNLSEGEKALQRKQSAEGSQYGGRALVEATQHAQGVASNEFGNFFNRLHSIAGIGANAAAGSAQTAVNMGNSMADTIQTGAINQANLGYKSGADISNIQQQGMSNLATLQTYNDLKNTLNQPTTTTAAQPNYASGNVTSKPSIFNY